MKIRMGVLGALLGVLLASIFVGQQVYAQKTTPATATAAPLFVPMPKDIQCELSGMSFRSVVGANAQLTETSGSVDGVTCWITGKTPEQKKDVPLASTEITRGIISTKDFGKLRITPVNSIYSAAVSIAIRRDKLPSFRAFLQKSDAEKGVEPAPNAQSHNEPLQAGTFQGSDSDGDSISVTLVEVEGSEHVLVQSVGHNFTGSGVSVDSVTAKDGKPFGSYESSLLKFPITFLVKFSPSASLTSSGGQVQVAEYDCTLSLKGKDNQPTLIVRRTKTDNGFSPEFGHVGFSPAASGFKMKDSYEFKLQKQ
jgi:hypothetical protein